MNIINLALTTIVCTTILSSCTGSTPTKTEETQEKQANNSRELTLPSWYGQHKYVQHYKNKLTPLFSGSLAINETQIHTLSSNIEYHAIGVVMNGVPNTKGKAGFMQLDVTGPCGLRSSVKSGINMLGGFSSCSPKDGKIRIELFNETNQTVEYVVYDVEKTKGN